MGAGPEAPAVADRERLREVGQTTLSLFNAADGQAQAAGMKQPDANLDLPAVKARREMEARFTPSPRR